MPRHPEWSNLTTEQKLEWLYDQLVIQRDYLNGVASRFDQLSAESGRAMKSLEERVKILEGGKRGDPD